MISETRYAKTADGVHIAYRVAGGGPPDIVYVPGWISNVDTGAEHDLNGVPDRWLRHGVVS